MRRYRSTSRSSATRWTMNAPSSRSNLHSFLASWRRLRRAAASVSPGNRKRWKSCKAWRTAAMREGFLTIYAAFGELIQRLAAVVAAGLRAPVVNRAGAILRKAAGLKKPFPALVGFKSEQVGERNGFLVGDADEIVDGPVAAEAALQANRRLLGRPREVFGRRLGHVGRLYGSRAPASVVAACKAG